MVLVSIYLLDRILKEEGVGGRGGEKMEKKYLKYRKKIVCILF